MAFESVMKQVRETNGTEGEHTPCMNGKLYLTKYHNYGAIFDLGNQYPEFIKGLSVALCAICTVLYVFSLGRKGKGLLKVGLAFLIGGAYSNTYDRLTRGYVVDYFGFESQNEKIRKMVFNISDFCIILGSVITVFKV